MDHKISIGLIQPNIAWEDISLNLKNYESLIIDSTCDLVLLPELFSTGFTMNVQAMAETMSGKTIQWMTRTAATKNIAIGGSIIIEEEKLFYNRFVFAMPDGTVQYADKRHLFRMGNENNHFTAGKKRLVVNYKGFRIMPLICYDLRFPVWSRNRNDYDILVYSANWPAARQEVWNTLLKARAIENQCYVVGVNRIGIDGVNIEYQGDSQFINARGEIIQKIDNTSGLIITEFSLDELNNFRQKFPALLDGDEFEIIF